MAESINEIEQSILELNKLYIEAEAVVNEINEHQAFFEIQQKINEIQNHFTLICRHNTEGERQNNETFFLNHLQTIQHINNHLAHVQHYLLNLAEAEEEEEKEKIAEIHQMTLLRKKILDIVEDLQEKEEAMKLQAAAFIRK